MLVPVRYCDVYQSNWLLVCASTRTGNTGDPNADVGVAQLPNVIRQRVSNFLADRAVLFDHRGWNIGKQLLQLMGIDNLSAEERPRTAGNGSDSLRRHSAGA